MCSIIPIVFNPHNRLNTDFSLLIRYQSDTLFLFNDSEDEFLLMSRRPGGGNACIRPYRGINAAGIPTGNKKGGYSMLDETTKKNIDKSFDIIKAMIKQKKFKRIMFSADVKNNKLIGSSIFKINKDVVKYISKRIWDLAS